MANAVAHFSDAVRVVHLNCFTVSSSMAASIHGCAALQTGRAMSSTDTSTPTNGAAADAITGANTVSIGSSAWMIAVMTECLRIRRTVGVP